MLFEQLIENFNGLIFFKQIYGIVLITFLLVDAPYFLKLYTPISIVRTKKTYFLMSLIWFIWLVSAILLLFPRIIFFNTFIIFLFHFYFFMYQNIFKKKFISFGVEGYFLYFGALYLTLIEFSQFLALDEKIIYLILFIFKIELALIMFSGGIEKIKHGFLKDFGFNYAYSNPKISRLYKIFQKLKPKHYFFKFVNYVGTYSEIISGLLLLIPIFSIYGSIVVIGIFTVVCLSTQLVFIPILMINTSSLIIYLSNAEFSLLQFVSQIEYFYRFEGIFISLLLFYLAHCIIFSLLNIFPNFISRLKFIHYYRKIILTVSVSSHSFTVFSPFQTGMFFRIYELDQSNKELKNIIFDGYSKHYKKHFYSLKNVYLGSRNIIRCSMPHIFNDNFKNYITGNKKQTILHFGKLMQTNNSYNILIERFQIIEKEDKFYYLPMIEVLIEPTKESITVNSKSKEALIPIEKLNK